MVRYLFFSSLLILSALRSECGAEAPSGKPRSPLSISISTIDPDISMDKLKKGDEVEMNVSALSLVDSEKVCITVEAVEGVEIAGGDSHWCGPVSRDSDKSLSFVVRITDSGRGEVIGRAELSLHDGNIFSAAASYSFGTKKDKSNSRPPIKKDSKGRDIREYR